jgi:outer membrane lipoprotein SlyB
LILRLTWLAALVALAGCGADYSPNTYASNAVQQANKVEQGTVVGVRDVAVSASGAAGAVVGGAAGGIAGAQVGVGPVSAFSALGGSLVGGLAGTAVEHAAGDTRAFEYIVRKTAGGDLVSVTQKDTTPLALGQHVLVIAGNQARVVPDYTVNLTPKEATTREATTREATTRDVPKERPAEAAKPAEAAASPGSDSPGRPPAEPAGSGSPAGVAGQQAEPNATAAPGKEP